MFNIDYQLHFQVDFDLMLILPKALILLFRNFFLNNEFEK